MSTIELEILIAGGVVPFAISLLKRFVTLSKEQISFVTMLVSFMVASIFELVNNHFDWGDYLSKLIKIYGTSKIIYWAVLKTLNLDTRIEGK
mgnify:CR=1 FL=1